MTKREIEARQSIIAAAIELIKEHGDVSQITMRDIASRANVGTGLINYHFQTKENLISICVQQMIGRVIGDFDPLYKSLKMEPMEKLKYLLRLNASFLVNNMGISRISILSDMENGNAGDNSVQTMQAYYPVLREVCGDAMSEEDIWVRLHVLISALQTSFLRHHVIKENLGIDYFDKEQRDAFVDKIIEIVLGGF